jgi:hypothetical protein
MLLNKIRQARRWLTLLALGFGVGVTAGMLPACHTDAVDCGAVCSRYRDCVDQNYDVGACQSRCEGKAGKDRDFDDALTHCESCTEGRTCSETVGNCIPACVGVVP